MPLTTLILSLTDDLHGVAMFPNDFRFACIMQKLARMLQDFAEICHRKVILFYVISHLFTQLLIVDQVAAEERTPPSDVRVGVYFNYYLPSYTNTPLFIRRECGCQLGYQTGVVIQSPMFWRLWFNFHGYVLGASPSLAQSPEQFGSRFEFHVRFERFIFLFGHHGEWDVYRSSNFPTHSREGNYISTGGLRETYIGITWLLR